MDHHAMEVRHRDDLEWETIRWPGETGKMMEPGAHHPLHTTSRRSGTRIASTCRSGDRVSAERIDR